MAAEVFLKDMSLSTSGSYEKFFYAGGRRYSHLMDPRTGYPAQERVRRLDRGAADDRQRGLDESRVHQRAGLDRERTRRASSACSSATIARRSRRASGSAEVERDA